MKTKDLSFRLFQNYYQLAHNAHGTKKKNPFWTVYCENEGITISYWSTYLEALLEENNIILSDKSFETKPKI